MVVTSFVTENIMNGKCNQISVEELDALIVDNKLNNYALIDARSVDEYEKGTIPGALNFPLDDIRNNLETIKNLNKPIIIYCQKGLRGYLAELILKHNGIDSIVNVAGGFKLWEMYSDKIEVPKMVQ